jgi:putative SOS response-associated peptidase YedK
MCGRYSITTPPEALRRLFQFANVPNLAPRWNVAPTQQAPVVRATPAGRALHLLRWGLIPAWAKDASIGARCINARGDSVAEKPAFRSAFRGRRCLVPADGFFEWRAENGAKQPYRIVLETGEPFAFAGLWEQWKGPAETIESFTIITTEANDALRPLHERMPVILAPEHYDRWLAGAPAEAQALLRPFPSGLIAFYRADPQVNNAKNDDPRCIAPFDPAAEPVHTQPRLL